MTVFTSCSKSDGIDDMGQESYNTEMAITDAPIDHADVKAAVVTITGVKVDGKSIEGFNTTTVDLMTLQQGKMMTLGNIDLTAKTYSSISLILDYESDAAGNFPGCYVETADGVKHQLKSSVNEIKINDKVDVLASTANKIVIDFDLRKTVIAATTADDQFDFVTSAELSSGLRLVNNLETGSISGTVSDSKNTSEKIVVFAYKTGTYTEAEAEGQGASNVAFANAVTSTTVNNTTNSFKLNFLKEGDYEAHFASYSDTDNDGELEFNGMLSVESLTNIQIGKIKVTSNINIGLNVAVTGIKQ
jgi:hypothetical protein